MIESLRVRVCGELPAAHVGPIETEPEMCVFPVTLANGLVLEVCCEAGVAQSLFAVLRIHGGPARILPFENCYDAEFGGGRSSLTSVEVIELLRRYADLLPPGPIHRVEARQVLAPVPDRALACTRGCWFLGTRAAG